MHSDSSHAQLYFFNESHSKQVVFIIHPLQLIMAWIPPGPERLSSSPCATPPSPSFASWCMRSTCSMTKTSWLRLHSPSTAWRQVCRWVTCCNVCCDKTSPCLHLCVGHQGIVQYLWRTATTKIWSWLLYWSTWTSSEGGWDTAMSSDLWSNTVMSNERASLHIDRRYTFKRFLHFLAQQSMFWRQTNHIVWIFQLHNVVIKGVGRHDVPPFGEGKLNQPVSSAGGIFALCQVNFYKVSVWSWLIL